MPLICWFPVISSTLNSQSYVIYREIVFQTQLHWGTLYSHTNWHLDQTSQLPLVMFTSQQWYYCCFTSEASQPIMTSLYEAMTSKSLVPCEPSVLCYLITLHKNSQGQTQQWTLPALGETLALRLEELPPKTTSCSLHPSGTIVRSRKIPS